MVSELKKAFLKLLDEDLEFRYAIAGLIGLREILNRLDKVEEEIKKLWENQNKLWESQIKLWEEIKALREGQNK
jgi:TctA family transporter